MGEVSTTRYILIFIGLFFVMTFILMGVSFFLPENLNFNGVTSVVPMLAALFTGQFFLKHENRIPTRKEKNKLVNYSLLAFLLINLLIIGLVLNTEVATIIFGDVLDDPVFKKILIGAFIFVALISYIGIRLGYGFLLTKTAQRNGIGDE